MRDRLRLSHTLLLSCVLPSLGHALLRLYLSRTPHKHASERVDRVTRVTAAQ